MFAFARWIACAAFFSCFVFGGERPEFSLRDGDTVVFFGDSITHQRLYTVFTEAYVVTRFPKMRVTFVHSGWGGDRVSGGSYGSIDERLARDVFAHKPTVVTIMLGMNDGEYRPFDASNFEKFSVGYRHILDSIKEKAPTARVTLIESSAYDDVTRPPLFEGGYNSVLQQFGKFVRELGSARGLTVADANAPVVALLRGANSALLIPDRVHPSAGVHLVMAESLLRAWHAPSLVTDVEIDGAMGKVIRAENTTIDSVTSEDGISWTQLDGSLPMPVEANQETVAMALAHSDFTQALNQELLKVTGLGSGHFLLRIDEEAVGSFTAGELESGINLGGMKTPMSRQARTVLDLTYRHNHLTYARNMMVQNAFEDFHPSKMRAALDAMDALHEEAVALQRAAAVPKAHRYRLRALSASP